MTQLNLLDSRRVPRFDGPDVTVADADRLGGQLERVRTLMADQTWRTLREIADRVSGSEAGVSARLRDLRKPRFGGCTVERRRRSAGTWEYRVVGSQTEAA